MPELPEVETIRRRLECVVVRKQLVDFEVLREKSVRGLVTQLLGASITAVSRKSKILQFDFDSPLHLLIHLKMTGQLLYDDGTIRIGGGHPTNDFLNSLPSSHTRAVLHFADSSRLFFNDMRVFGWLKIVPSSELEKEYVGLALDITDPRLVVGDFIARAQGRSVPIKQVIMDNAVVAGVGNIYACDALNLAKIDPRRRANTLSLEELNLLFSTMREVITLGISHGGATVSDFRSIDGLTGTYQNIRRVYKRQGEACFNCGAHIVKEQLGGRGTYYCPHCQV